MASQTASSLRAGQVLEITFPTFKSRITVLVRGWGSNIGLLSFCKECESTLFGPLIPKDGQYRLKRLTRLGGSS